MRRIRIGWLALVVVAAISQRRPFVLPAAGVPGRPPPRPFCPRGWPTSPPNPSAAEFARIFAGTTNTFAADHADPKRVVRTHCAQAAPGRYMCPYVVTRPGALLECRLMQARWAPEKASTITVTLAGRTARCGSLREALDSLE